ncbi:MAG TPA: acetoacetate decarboxylase family protein [Enhygromyxa sp.]|nr:acetoacetate decarboxylase family protein [Enhygromyxa sp.]
MTARYLPRDDEQTFAPPYVQAGCALFGFALPADRARLQRIVDRLIAEPSGGRVRAQVEAGHVLLYFCDFARSHSADPIDAHRGWLGERECGIWVPIRRPESRGPSFFVHAMIVDSGPAMCSGRELLGFPKQLGRIELSRDPARAALLAVDTLTTGDRRAEAGRWQPLIELERIDPVIDRDDQGSRLADLGLAAELLGADRPLDAARRAGRGQAEFINLKQFRDAADPSLACYQAIVSAEARLLGLTRVAATDGYAYRIARSLVDALGLPKAGRTRGLFCEFDFVLAHKETL